MVAQRGEQRAQEEGAAPFAGRRLAGDPGGLLVGLAVVAAITTAIYFIDISFVEIPAPTLAYTLPLLWIAYLWGWRVGAVVALVAFLKIWYFLVPPRLSWQMGEPGEWIRFLLGGAAFVALVTVGDSLRRVRIANARLAHTAERLDTIIVSIADGVLITDRDGTLTQTNEAMRRMLGGVDVPATLAERNVAWRTRRTDGTPFPPGRGPLSRALAGEIVAADVVITGAAGREVQLSVSSAPLRSPAGAIFGAVLVCRDVTELRRLQRAKDEFLAVASHELKTPLTSLGGYSQLLAQHLERAGVDDVRARRYLKAIGSQVRRVTALIDQLLDTSRLDSGRLQLHREPTDLVALVREAVENTGGLSERHPIAVEAEAPRIEGLLDRDRVEQVVVNLLSNAVRYTPDGGPIAVAVGLLPARDRAGQAAFVRVRDSGLGLAPEQLPRVFERFHQAHEQASGAGGPGAAPKGLGLGLYISREIVERHGGRIWAESAGPGRGATFTFTLPLAPPDGGPGPAAGDARGSLALTGAREGE